MTDDHAVPSPPNVPPIIHFIYLSDGTLTFGLIFYLAIKSARIQNQDFRILFHCNLEPSGCFWEICREFVEIVPTVAPTEICGTTIRLVHHRADLLRLRILYDLGGIYLDLDTICLKPFTKFLGDKVVMGVENGDLLCNAVIISPKGAKFVGIWLEAYSRFHNDQWVEFSGQLPWQLASPMPELIALEPRSSFFNPGCLESDLLALFADDREYPAAYIYHLWSSQSKTYIRNINVQRLYFETTTFSRAARSVIGRDKAILLELDETARATTK